MAEIASRQQDAFADIRSNYISRIYEFRDFYERCLLSFKGGETQQPKYAKLARHLHKLKGSGETYGFPQLTDAAKATERALALPVTGPLERQTICETLMSLIQTIERTHAWSEHEQLGIKPAAIARDEAMSAHSAGTGKMPKILIVEDDPEMVEVLRVMLDKKAELMVRTDGSNVLHAIIKEKPDLVILDNDLPAITGLEILETLQARGMSHSTRVIMISASEDPADQARSISAGALDYITKPFDAFRVGQRILSLTERSMHRVLIIDDDPSVADLLRHWFDRLGIEVSVAEDGLSAVASVIEARPDLILLDRGLPLVTGRSVLANLKNRAEWSDIPVIILSSTAPGAEALDWFKLGAEDYLTKPFNADQVVGRCMTALGLHQTEPAEMRRLVN